MKNLAYLCKFAVLLPTIGILSACAWVGPGIVCDHQGNCSPGVVFGGKQCPNGKWKGKNEPCGPSSDEIKRKVAYGSVGLSSTHSFVVTRPTGSMQVKIKRNGVDLTSAYFNFLTVGSTHAFSDPAAVESWLTSLGPQFSAYDEIDVIYDFGSPTVQVTSAPPNATVTVANTAYDDQGVAAASASTSFISPGLGGGCCEIMQ